ncbi:hypothetical protein ACS0TY_018284 [Phlomoides rotata]
MFADYLSQWIVERNLPGGGRGRKRGGSTTHRMWTFGEECELMCALKDLVVKGNECDNGFRSGYLLLLENKLVAKFPGTDLKGEPHINSKIHVWKRQYACLRAMLGNSGIGLNSTTYHVDALPKFWENYIKVDSFARTLRNKAFPFYVVCVDVVQEVLNEGTKKPCGSIPVEEAGDNTESHARFNAEKSSFTIDEESSATNCDKGKGVKRKHADNHEIQFMDQVGVFCASSKEKFGQIADTIRNIAERVSSEFDNRKRREQVYDLLNVFNFLSVDVRVEVAQYLFISLPDDAKTAMVKRIMRKLDLFNV